MKRWEEWKKADAEYAHDFTKRMDAMTPEPLFESFAVPDPKVCLRCGQERATSLLYSPIGMQPVLPLCARCAVDWNASSYSILKGIHPKTLLWRLFTFKVKHPFSRPSAVELYRDVQNMLRWVRKMKRLRKKSEDGSEKNG